MEFAVQVTGALIFAQIAIALVTDARIIKSIASIASCGHIVPKTRGHMWKKEVLDLLAVTYAAKIYIKGPITVRDNVRYS